MWLFTLVDFRFDSGWTSRRTCFWTATRPRTNVWTCFWTTASLTLAATIRTLARWTIAPYEFWQALLRRYLFTLKHRTVVGPFEQIWFLIVRYLKLSYYFLPETGYAYEEGNFADTLSSGCRYPEGTLQRFARIAIFEYTMAQ